MEAAKARTAERRVLLRNVSWETYGRLIEEREERPVPRFSYDRGKLEIMSPSFEQEAVADIIASLVTELAVELEIDVASARSTTFKREDLSRGFEPDASFYFRSIDTVRGKRNVDLDAGDPPPDLVIEVDVTNPSLDKLPIYARLNVAEVWRYAGGRLEILQRDEAGEGYEPATASAFLPALTGDTLTRFVEQGLATRRPAWARELREWARQNRPENPPESY
jgi:Uma2 family endonuclease